MPEIAEVRVVAKALKKQILNKKIKKINILYPNIIVGEKDKFESTLTGCTFQNIESYGKWLIFDLGEYSFLSHLRMEGKYFYVPREHEIGKHTHVIFELEDGTDLRYDDVRKFGRMELVKTSLVYENESIKKLGIEPDDHRLTSEYLLEKFKGKKQPIKTMLLDQTIINGLGNIYANEVLFASGINPLREGCSIDKKEAERIIDSSCKIITKSFEVGGCTIKSYTSSLGVIGHYQDYLEVHRREGMPCSRCGSSIRRVKLEGRSTYFCEKCQK